MHKPVLSAARVTGLVVGLLGAAMAVHWVFQFDAVTRVMASPAGIATPLLFIAAGLCLFIAAQPARSGAGPARVSALCCALLIALPLGYLFESLTGIGLGIDFARAGTVPSATNPYPGRVSPNASLAFLLTGIAIWLHGRRSTRTSRFLFLTLVLAVSVIGLGGLVGHFVGLEALYQVASFNRLLPVTAFGLSVVGAGLWLQHDASQAFDPDALQQSERRIKRRSLGVITLVALAGGVAGFAVMRDTFEQSVSKNMLLTATTNATSLAHAIDVSLWFPRTVTARPALRQTLDRLAKAPDDAAAQDFLRQIADSFLSADVTGVEIFDARGARVVQVGTMVRGRAQVLHRLANDGQTASVTWNDGYMLFAETEVVVDRRTVGRVLTEQRMQLFDSLLADIRASSDTSDVAICGREKDEAICAPNRFRPKGFSVPLFPAAGQDTGLPVTHALLGQRGVQFLKDRRGVNVLSAFTPVGTSGLGLAVRTDVDTLYAPLRSRLKLLVLALVGIIALAIYTQHSQVRPVIGQLVASERRVKAIVEDQTELVSLAKPDGELTYVNPAYARHFGQTPAGIVGRNLFDYVEPEDRAVVRQALAKVLSTGMTATGAIRMTTAEGVERWIAWTNRLQHDPSGAPVLHSVGHDVTERKRAETALRASERALRTLTAVFDATSDFVVQNDGAGRIMYMNPAARRRTGVALDAPVEHFTLADFNPPQTCAKFISEVGPTAVANGIWVGESLVWDAERRSFPVSHIVICHRDKHGKVEYFSALMRDISAAKAAEQALRDSEHRLRMVADNLPVLISYLDRDLRFRFVNRTYQQWFGEDAAPRIGASVQEFYGEQAWVEIEPWLRAALAGREVAYDRDMVRPEGLRHVQVTVVPDRDVEGHVVGLYTLISDVTSFRDAQRALQESEARLRTVADALPMRVAYIDGDERYRFNNLAYERGFGKPRDELHGRTVRELLGEAAYQSVEPHIRSALRGETVTFQSEMANAGSYVCYEANYIPQFAVDGRSVLGFHAVISDITRQKLEERRLTALARVDALTGLVNRAGFELRVAEAMERCRGTGALMALMYLDIDRFKQINDRFGHDVGDALLRAFAGRLTQALRSSDTVARLGGDEFTVIMEGLPRPEVAATVADKIVQAMGMPFVLDQQSLGITTSIGLAFYQGDATTAEALVKQADVMLYQAKGAGRNNVQMALPAIEGARA